MELWPFLLHMNQTIGPACPVLSILTGSSSLQRSFPAAGKCCSWRGWKAENDPWTFIMQNTSSTTELFASPVLFMSSYRQSTGAKARWGKLCLLLHSHNCVSFEYLMASVEVEKLEGQTMQRNYCPVLVLGATVQKMGSKWHFLQHAPPCHEKGSHWNQELHIPKLTFFIPFTLVFNWYIWKPPGRGGNVLKWNEKYCSLQWY